MEKNSKDIKCTKEATRLFMKELKALLKKHNADISFSVSECSDTYGLSDEKLVANIGRTAVDLAQGWSVGQEDL